jgi:tetratricopeptide (TPR) repeat protein
MWTTARSLAARVTRGSLLGPMLLAGCAAAPEPFVQLSGTSGPVSWEIVDVSQTTVPGQEIRWGYTLIVRTDGSPIQFETLETGSDGGAEGIHVGPFVERLESHGRLVIHSSYTLQQNKMNSELFGNSALGRHLDAVRLFHRLTGKDLDGRPIRVDVRFTLDAGLGAQTGRRPAGSTAQRPDNATTEPTPGEPSAAGPASLAHERIGADATALERALLDDLRDGSLDRHSPLEAALIVSGARDRQELDALRRRFEATVAPIVARVNGLSTPAERAPALLGALHPARTSQTPLLREYALNATTLIDVIETGRYNCVSATIVFTLLATRVGLDAHPVLVPSHARAAVLIGGRQVPVEATEPYGFDPSEAERRQILRRFRADVDAAPSYADEQTTDVDYLALLGAVYTNVSTLRSNDGNVAAAAAVARRADLLLAPADRAVLSRFRIGLLNEMAVESSQRGRHAEAVTALEEARRLAIQADDVAFVDQSLTVVALAWINEIGDSADDATVLAFADRLAAESVARDEVRSYALRLVAYRETQRREWAAAVRDLREAAALTRIPASRDHVARELARAELVSVDELASEDAERAWQAYQALSSDGDDAELASARRQVAHRVAVARIQSLTDQRRCEDLEAPLALWREADPSADPDGASVTCHTRRGITLWDLREVHRATDDFRRAYRLAPRDPLTEQNLLAGLQRLIADRIRAGQCQDARPLIAEGRTVAPTDTWFERAAARCGQAP